MTGGPDGSPRSTRRLAGPIEAVVLSQFAMAASAACLVFACARTLDRPISWWWYPAALLGAWAVYLRDSAVSCDAEDSISQPRRAAIFRGSVAWSWWLPVATVVAGGGCVMLARPHATTAILLGLVGVLGLVHATPLTDGSRLPGRCSTKRFAVIKSVVVSLAWAVAAVWLPLAESTPDAERPEVVAGIRLVLLLAPLLLADSLLLDLRDRIADRTYGLRTIAVRLGARGIHGLVGLLLGLSAITVLAGASDAIEPERWRRLGIATVAGLAVPWFCWRAIRRDEVATALSMMGWRFLAVIAVAA